MRNIIILFIILGFTYNTCHAQEQPGPEASVLLQKVAGLDKEGKTNDALALLDEGLEKFTNQDYDRYFTLNYKYMILMRLDRYNEAVKLAVEKANIIKSPKQALMVAETYLKIGNTEKAFDWISLSVDRGLQSYTVFNKKEYDSVRDTKLLTDLIEKIKKNIGIGLPAKPFIRKAISGKEVSLDKYKGKVVLLDFWATYCGPCIKEMPNIKECYNQNKEKGFDIIGFSLDKKEDRLKEYLSKNDISWEIVICPDIDDDKTVKTYEVVNIPASFLIDRKGIVRYVNLTGDDLKRAVVELVNE